MTGGWRSSVSKSFCCCLKPWSLCASCQRGWAARTDPRHVLTASTSAHLFMFYSLTSSVITHSDAAHHISVCVPWNEPTAFSPVTFSVDFQAGTKLKLITRRREMCTNGFHSPDSPVSSWTLGVTGPQTPFSAATTGPSSPLLLLKDQIPMFDPDELQLLWTIRLVLYCHQTQILNMSQLIRRCHWSPLRIALVFNPSTTTASPAQHSC